MEIDGSHYRISLRQRLVKIRCHHFVSARAPMYRDSYLCINIRDFLDRAAFPGLPVTGSHNTAISALAELFDELILGVDAEGRIESCKGVPLHRDAGGGIEQM